ncbi:MAG TPA: DNA primase [bacterium]|nr:DNA primase [bacterium]
MKEYNFSTNDDRKEIEEIKDSIDIINLISKYVPLKRIGHNYTAKCPFHTEKTPSFMVNPDLQRYKCYGCGKSGDIFNFLMEYENIDFPEALERLAKEAGVKLTKRKSPRNTKLAILEMINHLSTLFFIEQINSSSGEECTHYLLERGITKDSIKNFKIGFAPAGSLLIKHLQKKANFDEATLLQSGLFTKKSNELRDKFQNRIMFPIRNQKGKIIGFTGRVLPGNDFGPKYMNSPETPIFSKKNSVYGIYEARQEIRKENLVILCEGSTDVISAHQIGIKNIVAPLGTALTIEQVSLLKKFTKSALILFDNDDAGISAAERAFVLFSQAGMTTFYSNTGVYKDFDGMVSKAPEKAKSLVTEKNDAFIELLRMKINSLDITKIEDYKRIVKYITTLLRSISDQENRYFYISKSARILGKDESELKEIIEKRIKNESDRNQFHRNYMEQEGRNSTKSGASTPINNPIFDEGIELPTPSEIELLKQIIMSELYDTVLKLDIKYIADERINSILEFIKDELGKKGVKFRAETIYKNFKDSEYQRIFEAVLMNKDEISYQEISSEDIINTYKKIKSNFIDKVLIKKYKTILALEEEKNKPDENKIEKLIKKISTLEREKAS